MARHPRKIVRGGTSYASPSSPCGKQKYLRTTSRPLCRKFVLVPDSTLALQWCLALAIVWTGFLVTVLNGETHISTAALFNETGRRSSSGNTQGALPPLLKPHQVYGEDITEEEDEEKNGRKKEPPQPSILVASLSPARAVNTPPFAVTTLPESLLDLSHAGTVSLLSAAAPPLLPSAVAATAEAAAATTGAVPLGVKPRLTTAAAAATSRGKAATARTPAAATAAGGTSSPPGRRSLFSAAAAGGRAVSLLAAAAASPAVAEATAVPSLQAGAASVSSLVQEKDFTPRSAAHEAYPPSSYPNASPLPPTKWAGDPTAAAAGGVSALPFKTPAQGKSRAAGAFQSAAEGAAWSTDGGDVEAEEKGEGATRPERETKATTSPMTAEALSAVPAGAERVYFSGGRNGREMRLERRRSFLSTAGLPAVAAEKSEKAGDGAAAAAAEKVATADAGETETAPSAREATDLAAAGLPAAAAVPAAGGHHEAAGVAPSIAREVVGVEKAATPIAAESDAAAAGAGKEEEAQARVSGVGEGGGSKMVPRETVIGETTEKASKQQQQQAEAAKESAGLERKPSSVTTAAPAFGAVASKGRGARGGAGATSTKIVGQVWEAAPDGAAGRTVAEKAEAGEEGAAANKPAGERAAGEAAAEKATAGEEAAEKEAPAEESAKEEATREEAGGEEAGEGAGDSFEKDAAFADRCAAVLQPLVRRGVSAAAEEKMKQLLAVERFLEKVHELRKAAARRCLAGEEQACESPDKPIWLSAGLAKPPDMLPIQPFTLPATICGPASDSNTKSSSSSYPRGGKGPEQLNTSNAVAMNRGAKENPAAAGATAPLFHVAAVEKHAEIGEKKTETRPMAVEDFSAVPTRPAGLAPPGRRAGHLYSGGTSSNSANTPTTTTTDGARASSVKPEIDRRSRHLSKSFLSLHLRSSSSSAGSSESDWNGSVLSSISGCSRILDTSSRRGSASSIRTRTSSGSGGSSSNKGSSDSSGSGSVSSDSSDSSGSSGSTSSRGSVGSNGSRDSSGISDSSNSSGSEGSSHRGRQKKRWAEKTVWGSLRDQRSGAASEEDDRRWKEMNARNTASWRKWRHLRKPRHAQLQLRMEAREGPPTLPSALVQTRSQGVFDMLQSLFGNGMNISNPQNFDGGNQGSYFNFMYPADTDYPWACVCDENQWKRWKNNEIDAVNCRNQIDTSAQGITAACSPLNHPMNAATQMKGQLGSIILGVLSTAIITFSAVVAPF